MYNYRVFGINLQINIEIEYLVPAKPDQTTDIFVHIDASLPNKVERDAIDTCTPYKPVLGRTEQQHAAVTYSAASGFFHFTFDTGVQFVCNHTGTKAWGSWKSPYGAKDVTLYLLGPILGFILRLRGITCLHSCCLAIDDKALAIVGSSGAGKSTLALHFANNGYPVLTDDLLALKKHEDTIQAFPGYPRLKLWPSPLTRTLPDIAELPRLSEHWNKRFFDLNHNQLKFMRHNIPLKSIYRLDQSPTHDGDIHISIENPAAALPLLAVNTYRNDLLSHTQRTEEFEFLSSLLQIVPVKRITGYRNLSRLSELGALILEDFNTVNHHAI